MDKRTKMAELKAAMETTGWTKVIVPEVQARLLGHLELLIALKRPEGESDSILRGRIDEAKWFLSHFPQIIQEYEAEERKVEAAKQAAVNPQRVHSPYDHEPAPTPDNPVGV